MCLCWLLIILTTHTFLVTDASNNCYTGVVSHHLPVHKYGGKQTLNLGADTFLL